MENTPTTLTGKVQEVMKALGINKAESKEECRDTLIQGLVAGVISKEEMVAGGRLLGFCTLSPLLLLHYDSV